MIIDSLEIDQHEFERRTGWTIKPEGACKGDICVPLPQSDGSKLDARMLADRLGMPLLEDADGGLWALGPESGGRALTTVEAPDLVLPDLNGREFHLRALRGQKVLLVAWASW